MQTRDFILVAVFMLGVLYYMRGIDSKLNYVVDQLGAIERNTGWASVYTQGLLEKL